MGNVTSILLHLMTLSVSILAIRRVIATHRKLHALEVTTTILKSDFDQSLVDISTALGGIGIVLDHVVNHLNIGDQVLKNLLNEDEQ